MSGAELDLKALRNAVASLSDSLEILSDRAWFSEQPTKVRNTLLAGVIQNFEFVYEISIKMIKRRLELDSSSPNDVDGNSFRDIMRVAAERGLIADVEAWFTYRKMRNATAHTYDHEKAQQVCHDTLTFISDARSLLARLEACNG